ncbi:MAG: lipopolysaccharide heptosyltransferase II [candidate division Zixibacteria bacterium]|nr:lipopolysaccharide heptosyltransferase II [candidate division Zixibacteria bacterium]
MTNNIIIRTPNHLGDCIMSLPMINQTGEAHPGASITVLTPENLAGIYEQNQSIDNIVKIPSEHVHGLIAVMKIKDIISQGNYDLGYILPPSFGAAAGFKLAGIKNRIGYIADGRRLLLTKALPLPAPLNAEHRSNLYFNLLLRSQEIKLDYINPKLFLNDSDIKQGNNLLEKFFGEKDTSFCAIAFQAIAESRRWGYDNYSELIKKIVSTYNLKIVLVGSKEEQSLGDDLVKSTGGGDVINLAGKTSIRESASIISTAKFFVGNDSGAAHLAGAVGIPIIVLSGADDPKSTSPVTANKKVIYLDDLECISCVKNKCPLKGDDAMQCMKGISVEMVLKAISELVPVL